MHEPGSPPLLQLHDLEVRYRGQCAVHPLTLTLPQRSRACIIGANGAGKSSVLNAIAGSVPIAGGQILLDGIPLHPAPAEQRVRAGIALVPEGRGILGRLSVAENLQLGAYIRADRAQVAADIDRLLTRLPPLRARLHQPASTLSGGEQQMLAIARALLTRPRLLLLDEPSMGLAPMMVTEVYALLDEISASGVSLLLVEQNARVALAFAETVWVMENGRIVLQAPAAEIAHDARLRALYLGEAD